MGRADNGSDRHREVGRWCKGREEETFAVASTWLSRRRYSSWHPLSKNGCRGMPLTVSPVSAWKQLLRKRGSE